MGVFRVLGNGNVFPKYCKMQRFKREMLAFKYIIYISTTSDARKPLFLRDTTYVAKMTLRHDTDTTPDICRA